MKHATSNADRTAQIAERAAAAAIETPAALRAQMAAGKAHEKATRKAAAPAKTPRVASTKPEKATEWGMGIFHPGGVRILARGDHNVIEAASAAENKRAGMRVAFVVDIRSIPLAMLAETEHIEAGEEEDGGDA